MPRGDRTGPAGAGPMTGRGAGFCTGYDMAGCVNPIGGRGYRAWGAGPGGRGFRWRRIYPPVGLPISGPHPQQADPAQDIESLKQQAEYLSGTLNEINKRIEQIEASGKK